MSRFVQTNPDVALEAMCADLTDLDTLPDEALFDPELPRHATTGFMYRAYDPCDDPMDREGFDGPYPQEGWRQMALCESRDYVLEPLKGLTHYDRFMTLKRRHRLPKVRVADDLATFVMQRKWLSPERFAQIAHRFEASGRQVVVPGPAMFAAFANTEIASPNILPALVQLPFEAFYVDLSQVDDRWLPRSFESLRSDHATCRVMKGFYVVQEHGTWVFCAIFEDSQGDTHYCYRAFDRSSWTDHKTRPKIAVTWEMHRDVYRRDLIQIMMHYTINLCLYMRSDTAEVHVEEPVHYRKLEASVRRCKDGSARHKQVVKEIVHTPSVHYHYLAPSIEQVARNMEDFYARAFVAFYPGKWRNVRAQRGGEVTGFRHQWPSFTYKADMYRRFRTLAPQGGVL